MIFIHNDCNDIIMYLLIMILMILLWIMIFIHNDINVVIDNDIY